MSKRDTKLFPAAPGSATARSIATGGEPLVKVHDQLESIQPLSTKAGTVKFSDTTGAFLQTEGATY